MMLRFANLFYPKHQLWRFSAVIIVHAIVTFLFYSYVLENSSDASYYWFQPSHTLDLHFTDLMEIGNRFILLINYPLAVGLKLPFWAGMGLYSFIGLFAIWQCYRLLQLIVGKRLVIFVLPLFLFLPNLHVWTSGISKEVLCLLSIATIFIQIAERRFKSWQLWGCIFILGKLRPHVAFMLTAGIGVAAVMLLPLSQKRRLTLTAILSIALFSF